MNTLSLLPGIAQHPPWFGYFDQLIHVWQVPITCACKNFVYDMLSSWSSSQLWALKHDKAHPDCSWGHFKWRALQWTHRKKKQAKKRSRKGCTLKCESGSSWVDSPCWTSAGNISRPSFFSPPTFFVCYYVSQINFVIFALQVNFFEQTIVYAWNAHIKRWDCVHRLNTNLKISKCLNIITSFI